MIRTPLKRHLDAIASGLSERTDSTVVQVRTLRKAIGFIALALPVTLVLGENIRDLLLPDAVNVGRAIIEGSISAYFHTGMREIFVGSLCAIAMFLVSYKGPQRWDDLAANIAGFSLLLVAVFPTFEQSREATDTAISAPDSVTLFSGANGPDPEFVGYVHFAAAAIFFVTLALMSLILFTKSDKVEPTPQKRQRNRVFVVCGITILACIMLVAFGKLFLSDQLEQRTGFVFWLEAMAVIAFGISWLTKAEFFLEDDTAARAGRVVPNRLAA